MNMGSRDGWQTPPMALTHLLYLHGFRSSPQSTKARQMAARLAQDHLAVHWWCPALPASPREAIEQVLRGTTDWPAAQMGVVGSSLGGFYATVVAQARGCKAVLLNPAVDPARDLARHVGHHPLWHEPTQTFEFEPAFVGELQALQPQVITDPQRYYAIVAKGDEVLDWREMVGRYPGAQIRLLEGSDHALSDFDTHIDSVIQFLGLG